MALGPIARVLVQATMMGVSIMARALPAAYAAALANAKKGGVDATKASEGVFARNKMALDEAMLILNIESKKEVNPQIIKKQYEKYFEANAVEKGGSFYLQSKVYRAKEMLDEFVKEQRMEDQEQPPSGK